MYPAPRDWPGFKSERIQLRPLSSNIIEKAFIDNRVLVTNDKDFGEKVYRERRPHKGVVLLRLEDERSFVKIDIIRRLLESYADKLPGNFVVVTERSVRFARSL